MLKHSTNMQNLNIASVIFAASFIRFIPVWGELMFALSALIILSLEISHLRKSFKTKGNYLYLVVIMFFLLNIAINLKNGGDNSWSLLLFNCLVGVSFSHQCYIQNTIRPIYLFTITCDIWVILSFIDVVYKVLFTNYDSHKVFLLLCGYDNGLGCYLIPTFCLNYFLLVIGKKKSLAIVSMLLSTIQIFLVQSATAMVAISLIALLAYLSRNNLIRKILKPIYFLIISVVTFITIIVFRAYDNKIMRWIIEGILHRSMNFTGRTSVWNKAIAYFLTSPIWGHGRDAMYQKTIFFNVTSAHNIYLDVLTQCGIIGLTLFGLVLLIISLSNKNDLSQEKWFLQVAFFALIIALQFESYCGYNGYPLVFILQMLAYFIPMIDYEQNIRRTKTRKITSLKLSLRKNK